MNNPTIHGWYLSTNGMQQMWVQDRKSLIFLGGDSTGLLEALGFFRRDHRVTYLNK